MKPVKLLPAEHSVIVWHWTAPEGTDRSALFDEEYWAHVARQLKPGHEIKVVAEDGSWWMHLYVRVVDRNRARVQVLHEVELGDTVPLAEIPQDNPFEVKWRGPAAKWGVVRKSDGEVIKDHLPERADANRYISEKLRTLAA